MVDQVGSIINDIKIGKTEIVRFKYMPYSLNIAKRVWFGIATNIIGGEIQKTNDIVEVWTNLIKYVHGDDSCKFDLTKSICLMGKTGSGKSETMRILSKYIEVDDVKFKRNNKVIPFNFSIYSSRDIVSDFNTNGYDGIEKYQVYSNICIDDLGAEPIEAVHFGTRLNVINEIIEERYKRGLTTHFTTNLNFDLIRDRYNDRVHSRMNQQCNKIILNDKDFRDTEKTLF